MNSNPLPKFNSHLDTIWKFVLNPDGFVQETKFVVAVTEGAEVLHIDFQGPQLCAWVRMNPTLSPQNLDICVVGTGENVPDEYDQYINTFFKYAMVFHAFTKEML